MRLNNPKTFNGEILATQNKVADWLGLDYNTSTQSIDGFISAGLIPITGIEINNNNFSIYGTTITLDPTEQTPITIKTKFEQIASAIAAVKQYKAQKVNNTAISISTSSGTSETGITTDTFNIGLTLDGNSLTQSNNGLKITDNYVDNIISGNNGLKLTKLTTPTEGYASSYKLKYNDIQLGDIINISKDQFLKSADYFPSITAEQADEAGGADAGFYEGDPAIKFVFWIYINETYTETKNWINVKTLVDKYTAASGITLVGTQFRGVVDPAGDKYLTLGANGFKLSGVSGDIEYLSGAIDNISQQVSSTNKFTYTNSAIPSSVQNPANDTLYYNNKGQIMIYDDNNWHNALKDVVTTIEENVSDNTLATSKAIKTYVDSTANDINTEVEKKVELYEITKLFGGLTTVAITGRILAVYDSYNKQVYPDIVYNSGVSTISITDITVAEQFTIVYTKTATQTE